MNIYINEKSNTYIETLIVGLPEHINQLRDIKYKNQSIIEQLETLKQHHIIGSSVGKISSTLLYINDQPKRLLTVGLGNLKELSYQRLLKVWGYTFQYLKQEHINEAEVLIDTFMSKHNDVVEVAKTLGLQSEQSIYQFDNYKSDKKRLINHLFIYKLNMMRLLLLLMKVNN